MWLCDSHKSGRVKEAEVSLLNKKIQSLYGLLNINLFKAL